MSGTNVLVGENFVLEISWNKMSFKRKRGDEKEVESFIPLTAMGLGADMTPKEYNKYLDNFPRFVERFGEKDVLEGLQRDEIEFSSISDSSLSDEDDDELDY